ncbi:MAG: hypothetical protein RBR35_05865 [Salinivirgaceae bacterium]|nr:hypothetical protein [Salinivirgaceae bacterium]MDY0280071.1 hypothetical protein [Salinivirgaceae bacterium]
MLLRVYILLIAILCVSCNPTPKHEIIENHPNGSPKIRKTYTDNVNDSTTYLFEELYDNGTVKIKGEIVNEERNGAWNAYYENGKLWSYGIYSNGLREGRSIVYNNDGTIKLSGYYKDNRVDSLWVTFKPNGDTAQVTKYKDGEIVTSFYNDNLPRTK